MGGAVGAQGAGWGLSAFGEAYVRPSRQTNHIGARLVAWTVNYLLPIPKTQKEIASDRL